MSKKNQNDWIKAIQLTKDTEFERNLQLYLKKSLAMAKLVDIPCFIDEVALKKASDLKKKFHSLNKIINLYTSYLLDKYSNIINNLKQMPMIWSEFKDITPGSIQALLGTVNSSKMRQPLQMNLNVKNGNFNMIRVFTPLLSNPNAPIKNYSMERHETTPIFYASKFGHLEILKFLAPLSKNLTVNALRQAIHIARIYRPPGYDTIVEYLLKMNTK